MNSIKNKKFLFLSLFTIIFIAVTYIYYNSLEMDEKLNYSGTSNVADINLSRVTDYGKFMENKNESIIIYNEPSELRGIKGFITGEVKIHSEFFTKDTEYKLKFIKRNGDSFFVSLFPLQEVFKEKIISIPFTAFDTSNGISMELREAVLIAGENEIAFFKLKRV